jgi:hypothetical protein
MCNCDDRSPLYEIKNVFSIVMTVTGIVLAGIAYGELKAVSSDIFDIIDNWKTEPILEAYVADYNIGCRSGYDKLGFGNADFTGVQKGHCGCTPNSFYMSTYPNCSSEAEATNECMTAPSRSGIPVKSWRSELICVKRGGQAAASWRSGYVRRPYPSSKGKCPTGYRKCGTATATYEDDRAVCFPEDEVCPLTGMLIAANTNPPTDPSWIKAEGNFSDGHSLYIRREFPGELPIVDFQTGLTEYGSDDYLTDGYKASKNKRGPCYIGNKQEYSSSVAVSDVAFAEYSIKAPSSCKRVDKRYVMYDKIRRDQLWLKNFELDSACSGFTLYPEDDPAFNPALDADYLKSGVPCGGSPYTCDR